MRRCGKINAFVENFAEDVDNLLAVTYRTVARLVPSTGGLTQV